MNKTWVYIVAGTALVVGGLALLARAEGGPQSDDPIAEAQRMLSRAQTKVSEIEAGLRSSRPSAPEAA
ncbi:MAG TPA: hypothetical protein VGM37_16035 [Armatimonadota bacterium]